MSIHGKDIEPSLLSDYQPSPLLQVSESGKSKRINRRDIPIPVTPKDSVDSGYLGKHDSNPSLQVSQLTIMLVQTQSKSSRQDQ